MLDRTPKRITAFVGHYGSGKSEVAASFALWLKGQVPKVTVADMDTVNPYYRLVDAKGALVERGIEVLSIEYANTNVDMPTLNPQFFSLFDNKDIYGVFDIGGDEDGAIPLGSLSRKIAAEEYDVFAVINQRRPLTATVEDTLEYLGEIERACRLTITGLINNTNLGNETTPEVVLASLPYAREVSKKSGIPLIATTALKELGSALVQQCDNLFPIEINIRHDWL